MSEVRLYPGRREVSWSSPVKVEDICGFGRENFHGLIVALVVAAAAEVIGDKWILLSVSVINCRSLRFLKWQSWILVSGYLIEPSTSETVTI